MPYIEKKDRLAASEGPINAGDLTYNLYATCVRFADGRKKFITFCIVMGALVCTMFEFYRRKVAPYEDTKIEQNGDV